MNTLTKEDYQNIIVLIKGATIKADSAPVVTTLMQKLQNLQVLAETASPAVEVAEAAPTE